MVNIVGHTNLAACWVGDRSSHLQIKLWVDTQPSLQGVADDKWITNKMEWSKITYLSM